MIDINRLTDIYNTYIYLTDIYDMHRNRRVTLSHEKWKDDSASEASMMVD